MEERHHERGALISDHPHPRPALRGLTTILVAAGLIGEVDRGDRAAGAERYIGLPLLPLMAFFLADAVPGAGTCWRCCTRA